MTPIAIFMMIFTSISVFGTFAWSIYRLIHMSKKQVSEEQ